MLLASRNETQNCLSGYGLELREGAAKSAALSDSPCKVGENGMWAPGSVLPTAPAPQGCVAQFEHPGNGREVT